ncbi:conserved hypothetical protein [Neospora caninum Liverpool]|uniref:Uncharacterized protein n=1 Tax=Neospora caninum (strain Liverpool) TaxID=572307 RepID=F0VJ28_NEOCL|nr:conserved hypothetical protein [Neospora caninum Liverpool]CBZ53739.1 conserved hypothetical protein [Neospora caninum Liverpool]|eukprot:XP_003883771.1 conserved hypothetical protein [Neospora caninum Liverpool]
MTGRTLETDAALRPDSQEGASGSEQLYGADVLIGFSPFPQRTCGEARPLGTGTVGKGDTQHEAGTPGHEGDARSGEVRKLAVASAQRQRLSLCCFKPSTGAVSRQGVFPSHVGVCPPSETAGEAARTSRSPVASVVEKKRSRAENTESPGEAVGSAAAVCIRDLKTRNMDEAHPCVAETRLVSSNLTERGPGNASLGDNALRPDTLWIAAVSVPTLLKVFDTIAGPDEADLVTQWRDQANRNRGSSEDPASESKGSQRSAPEIPSTDTYAERPASDLSVASAWRKVMCAVNDAPLAGGRTMPRVVLLEADDRMENGERADANQAGFRQKGRQEAPRRAPEDSDLPKRRDSLPDSTAENTRVTGASAPDSYIQRMHRKLERKCEVPVVSLHVSERMRIRLEQMQAAIQVIAASESVTNLARFDGMRDAEEENLDEASRPYWVSVLRRRSQGFTDEAKECMLAGAYALSQFATTKLLDQALAVRTALAETLSRIIDESEILVWVSPAKQVPEEFRESSKPAAPVANATEAIGRSETPASNQAADAYLGERWMHNAAELLGLPLLQLQNGVTLLGRAGTDRGLLEKVTLELHDAVERCGGGGVPFQQQAPMRGKNFWDRRWKWRVPRIFLLGVDCHEPGRASTPFWASQMLCLCGDVLRLRLFPWFKEL